ncbi:MAG: hypothetical protein RI894_959 [Bacteroidota bacterium]|jgi:hypothetical protein
MIIQIETNKKNAIDAFISLCKALSIKYNIAESASDDTNASSVSHHDITAALKRYDSGDKIGVLTFENSADARKHFGL